MMSNFYLIYGVEATGSWTKTKVVEFVTFSDGCEVCRLGSLKDATREGLRVVVRIEDGQRDIIRLGLIKEALDNLGFKGVTLTLDYVPNARADRRFAAGESFSLKVTCNIINSFGFSKINITDPHSDVTPALLNNVEVNTQVNIFNDYKSFIKEKEYILVAPDLGAAKKTFDLAKKLGHTDYIQAVKIRDISTGQIVKCDVQYESSLEGKTVVMVDDIADGGASFIHLGKKLKEKGASKVILFVTHGIFSKGLAPLVGVVDQIICPHLIEKHINTRDIELFNS